MLKQGWIRVREWRGRIVSEFHWPESHDAMVAIVRFLQERGSTAYPFLTVDVHDLKGKEYSFLGKCFETPEGVREVLEKFVRADRGKK